MKKGDLSKQRAEFPKEKLLLENKTTRKQCEFILRPWEPGDEAGVIACIRSEYGETYFKRAFYEKEKLRELAMGEHYQFFVAQMGRKIAGMLIFTFFMPEEDCLEPASEILLPDVRGFGLAKRFAEYVFPLAKKLNPGCIFVHAVTFHSITQHICEAQGMQPVGFRLGTFLVSENKNSYGQGKCVKQSEGLYVLPVGRQDAGTVYLPKETAAFSKKVYDRLGITYKIVTEESFAGIMADAEAPAGTAERQDAPAGQRALLAVSEDTRNRSCLIELLQHGSGLEEQIQKLLSGYEAPGWTVQIRLDADTPLVFEEYRILRRMGFFFTGLRPLCSSIQRFYMQWCGDLELSMEEYCLTEKLREIGNEIETFYCGRIRA